ncbi:MAG: type II toxin-antitoxin system VapC family toxin [Planctomycetes bacterium]|nr:type II toxin-antitoxin system VapC family toxin [Planctomycetota bacterium]
MTLAYLLDTNVLSDLCSRRPNRRLLSRVERHSRESGTAAPVLHELRYGCELLPPSRKRDSLEDFVQGMVEAVYPVLPYDQAAAAWHAVERARLERLGRTAPFVDGMIASIARVNDLTLVTGNIRDYRNFRDLRLEDWSR